MPLADWAEQVACTHLAAVMPKRWRHVQGVVRRAQSLAGVVDDPDLLIASAWLHDIGYTPDLRRTGFHPVDGAQYLRQRGADERLCALVAHHSCARVEARRRGIVIDWPDERTALRDALWCADMTTTPNGEATDLRSRIAEVRERYGPDDVVAQSIGEAEPELRAAVQRTERLLSNVG
ncbi:phosphohydrolase [Nocardia sp. CS682]|nr:phosphohydrolase [Nocardia sp. CS682]